MKSFVALDAPLERAPVAGRFGRGVEPAQGAGQFCIAVVRDVAGHDQVMRRIPLFDQLEQLHGVLVAPLFDLFHHPGADLQPLFGWHRQKRCHSLRVELFP